MSSRLSNAIAARLVPMAQILKNTIVDFAPRHLVPYIHVTTRQEGELSIIRIDVNRGENPSQREGSLDARAQEFGSGLSAQIGDKHLIRFAARNAPALIFDGTNGWVGKTIYMPVPRKVNHPGIQAANQGEGYIRPAVREFEGTIINALDPTIRSDIDFEIRTTFGHATQKSRRE